MWNNSIDSPTCACAAHRSIVGLSVYRQPVIALGSRVIPRSHELPPVARTAHLHLNPFLFSSFSYHCSAAALLIQIPVANESVTDAGGIQWMTGAGGRVHAEVSPTSFHGTRRHAPNPAMWLNRPARLTISAPRRVEIQEYAIPTVPMAEDMTQVKLISRLCNAVHGPKDSFDWKPSY